MKISESDLGFSYHMLGDDYYYNRNGKQKDDTKAFENWLKGAELGNVQCAENVLWACRDGIGVEKNSPIANRFKGKVVRYYSDPQILQDKWVELIFNGMRKGYFLDIGASDGVGGSNTKMLEDTYGWGGICIEPNPIFFRQLVNNRRAECINACIAPTIEEVTFRSAGFYGGIERNLKEWHKGHWKDSESIMMFTRRLGDILEEVDAPEVIDYMSLDIEGGESDILESFPWDKYKVRAMTIEKSDDRLKDLVKMLGFRIVTNPFSNPSVNWEVHCVIEEFAK